MTPEKQVLLDMLHRQTVLMREAQKNYWRIASKGYEMTAVKKNALIQAKSWESKVDNTIEQINKLPQQKFSF